MVSVIAYASAATASSKSPVSIRVHLNVTTVRGGRPIHGTAILTNASPKTILVEACAYDGWLFVGLTNKSVTFDPAVAAVACNATIKLKPGTNRFPIAVSTDYGVCYENGGTPACGRLPSGTYHVAVVTQGLPKGTSFESHLRVTLT
jgi:streptogramin lyase